MDEPAWFSQDYVSYSSPPTTTTKRPPLVKLKTVSAMLLASKKFAKRNKVYTKECSDNLHKNCRYFLVFGKLIGLVPLGAGLTETNEVRGGNFASRLIGVAIVVMLLANTAIGLRALGKSTFLNAAEYSRAPIMFAFYSCGAFIYFYFHRNCATLLQLFASWNRLNVFFTEPDRKLKRDVNLVAGFILTSAILENAVSQVRLYLVEGDKRGGNMTFFQVYYTSNYKQWEELVPYSLFMGLYTFVADKLAYYAWNYADVLVYVFARALAFKFKALCRQSEAICEHRQFFHDPTRWQQMTKDHQTLYNYMLEVTEYLSPLIFVSFAINLYCLCLQIHFGLQVADSRTVWDTLYAIWSMAQLYVRIYMMISLGSRLNLWAHKLVELLRRCPADGYSLDILRAERFINRNIISLTGLGCFHLTKPLFLNIIGVVFTFEIVLLQAQGQISDSNADSNCTHKS